MKIPTRYGSDNLRDSLYEEHGATLKHKCGKRIVTLPPLLCFFSFFNIFSLFFSFFGGLLWPLFLFGQCSNNDDHHTSIDYNIRITTRNLEQDMTLYECIRRCIGICNESRATCMKIMKVALPQI